MGRKRVSEDHETDEGIDFLNALCLRMDLGAPDGVLSFREHSGRRGAVYKHEGISTCL